MTARIKTNIKFYKGLDNVADQLYGFVTKVNGSWRGCREEDCKKKIVFVDASIINDIVPNVLYSCSLVPMHNKNGFIAQSATIVKFKGVVHTICRKGTYVVIVKFGNKRYVYDAASTERRKSNIQQIADTLRQRIDLIDAHQVAEEFVDSACMVKRLYQQSLADVH